MRFGQNRRGRDLPAACVDATMLRLRSGLPAESKDEAMVDLGAARSRLEAELREMVNQHSRISAHLRNVDRDVPDDWTEMAQFMENDEVLEALEEHTRERVDSIVRAVTRIDNGTYTTCSSCGNTISDERLDLLDATTVCSTCA
jgi:RNA polymerase-binding transcription factor DksA